jgi:5-methylcytosine-specific restriction endonuclease McrA
MGRNRRSFTPEVRESILRRDNYVCAYCGRGAISADHVLPVCQGGPNIKANGVGVCVSCNTKKGGKLREEFLRRGLFVLLCAGEPLGWLDQIGVSYC